MNIIIALLLFSVIVIFHEFGHFILARANGVEVTEFSLGMGPRIITFVKTDKGCRIKFFVSQKVFETEDGWKGKTKYSLKILPFGGSCIMLGEDDVVDSDNAFCKKSVYARMSVVFAGPFFNFIFAFVMSIIVIACSGYDKPVVSSVEAGMPMAEAGVLPGDEVVKINNSRIRINREISSYFMFNPLQPDKELTMELRRNGENYTVTVLPKEAKIPSALDGFCQGETTGEVNKSTSVRVGFGYSSERIKGTALDVVKYSFYEVKYWIVTTVKSLGMLVTGKLSKDDLSGPVGIVTVVGDMVDQSKSLGVSAVVLNLLYFGILLSANLGVMNLLPIPALDGGRLLFQIIEVIRRKPIDPEKEGIVTMIGFALLMALMVFVMFNDITRLFTK